MAIFCPQSLCGPGHQINLIPFYCLWSMFHHSLPVYVLYKCFLDIDIISTSTTTPGCMFQAPATLCIKTFASHIFQHFAFHLKPILPDIRNIHSGKKTLTIYTIHASICTSITSRPQRKLQRKQCKSVQPFQLANTPLSNWQSVKILLHPLHSLPIPP